MSLDLRFTAISLLSGQVLGELVDLQLTSPLAATIGQSDQATATLFVNDATPAFWTDVIEPFKSAIVCWIPAADGTPVPLGGVTVEQYTIDAFANAVELQLVTLEAYLDRVQVGALTATNVNQDTLLTDILSSTTDLDWSPFALVHTVASTQTQSVTYTSQANTTVYAALQSVSGVQGGPEWTIGWEWSVSGGSGYFRPVFYYGQTVGTIVTSQPKVTITLPDCVALSVTKDYSDGYGANIVTAYGVEPPADAGTTTDVLPAVTVEASDFDSRPPVHYVYEPSAVVSDTGTLTDYADAALNEMQDGGYTITATLPNDAPGKTLGIDWALGDSIGCYLDGFMFPTAISGITRCIGWELDYFSIQPTFEGAMS